MKLDPLDRPDKLVHLMAVASAISPDEEERSWIRNQKYPLTVLSGDSIVTTENGLAATTYLLLSLSEAVLNAEEAKDKRVEKTLLALAASINQFILPRTPHDIYWEQEDGCQEIGVVMNLVGTFGVRLLRLYGMTISNSERCTWKSLKAILDSYSSFEFGTRTLNTQRIREGRS